MASDLYSGGSGKQYSGGEEDKTNLIVNYLPQSMVQEELLELFSGIGVVQSCKVILDRACYESTGGSLGYGFVNYHRHEDAKNAINNLNGLRLENKTIKVSYARPNSEAIRKTNLYVAGFSKEMSEQDFEAMFSAYGRIITSRVLRDNWSIYRYAKRGAQNVTGLSKGVGFIRFDQRLDAERAIYELNGTIPNGCTEPITVRFANNFRDYMNTPLPRSAYWQPRSIHRFAPTTHYRYSPMAVDGQVNPMFPVNAITDSGWTIFVYNLPPAILEIALRQLFEPFGVVQSVSVIRHMQTNQCKGYGFVTMANYIDAVNAIQAMNGFTLANRQLQVSFKTNKSKTSDVNEDDEVFHGLHIKRPRYTVAGIDSKTY